MWIDGQIFTLAQQTVIFVQNPAGAEGSSIADSQSGSFTHTIANSGPQTVGIGVVNGTSGAFQTTGVEPDPMFTISFFDIIPVTFAPEPASLGAVGAGLLGCAWLLRKRRAG